MFCPCSNSFKNFFSQADAMVENNQDFQEDEPRTLNESEPIQLSLFLTLEGFEGPIDVLLSLAREQKVDLTQIQA